MKVRELKNFPQEKAETWDQIDRIWINRDYNQALQEIGDLDIPEQERLDMNKIREIIHNLPIMENLMPSEVVMIAQAICSHFSAPKREVDVENKEELKKAIESGKSELSRLESEDIRADWHEELAILVNFCDNILAQAIKQSLESEG